MDSIKVHDGNEAQYDFKGRSDRFALLCTDPSLTVQADAEDADINTIVRRFNLTGTMPQGMRIPEYGDYEGVFDFHSAQLAILQAEKEFMLMPAEVRAQFGNDPGTFLQMASDPANVDLMVELGLAIKKPVEENVLPESGGVDKNE